MKTPNDVQNHRHCGALRRPYVAMAKAALAVAVSGSLLILGGCASDCRNVADGSTDYRHLNPSGIPDAVPRVEPKSKSGNMATYVARGKRYYTKQESAGHVERGVASWYGKQFNGRRTSSGERYDMYAMTAAHKTLPLPTYARVTNIENGRSAVVRINDRGPFHGPRVIDLSYAAATKIGVVANGTAMVEVRAIDPGRPDSAAGPIMAANRPATESPNFASSTPPARHDISIDLGESIAPTESVTTRERAVAAAAAVIDSRPIPTVASADERDASANRDSIASAAGESRSTAAVTGEPGGGGGQGLYVQVGAFGDRQNAERLRERLSPQLDEQVRVQRPGADGANLYKVRVGPLASAGEARRVSAKLSSLGVSEPRTIWN